MVFSQMQLEWASRYNGPVSGGFDASHGIFVDSLGNVHVTGAEQLSDLNYTCTTIKYNKFGDSLWVRKYQRLANNDSYGYDIKVDDSGNVYVAGAESVLKYDKSGNLLWTAFDSANYRLNILDSKGNIFAAGIGLGEFVVGKYDRGGNKFWVNRQHGGYRLYDMVLDNSGNIVITGTARYSGTFYDYTTIKYSNSGKTIWKRTYNGTAQTGDDYPYALTADDSDNIYVTGASQDENSIFNCATIKYDSAGSIVWIKRIYPPSNGQDIAVDESNNVYIASRSNGNNYATKLDPDGNILWMKTYPTTNAYATNLSRIILDSVNNVYVSANIDSNHYTWYGAIKYDNDGNRIFVVNYHYVTIGYNYVYDMALDKKGNVYLTGESNTAFGTVKYSEITTNISGNNIQLLEYKLEQNYPNPFNPSTSIGYKIGVRNFVSLKIFDITGKEAATLVNQTQDAGSYSVDFNAANLPSGIYFYKMESGDFKVTKRMILIK